MGTKVITVVDYHTRSQMEAITLAKFAAWDRCIALNVFDQGTPSELRHAYELLADPTIFAYAFFQDPDGQPMRLYYYQDRIINDQSKRIIFAAANQIGKSVTLCLKALHFALSNPGTTTLMVSKTLPQSKDLLRQIKRFLSTSKLDWKADIGDTDNRTEITFTNKEVRLVYDEELKQSVEQLVDVERPSRIICVPATEAALGYAIDLVLEDELAFFEDSEHFHEQVIQPRTYHTKGQIIAFSNPNGQQGMFWKMWQDDDFSHYQFRFIDCPANNQEEYELLCKKLSRDIIDSTLDAVFTDPKGGFMSLLERQKMQEQRPNALPAVITQPLYGFLDWGKSRDNTIFSLGIPVGVGEGRGVYVYEMREYPLGTPYNEIVDDVEKLSQELGVAKIAMIGWDNTGVGRGIEDFIKRLQNVGIQLMPVEFTLENKSRIYTIFKLLVERNLREEQGVYGIKIPYVASCDKQLASLIFTKTSRGYLQVHHAQETDHDDYPDSLAGLVSIIMQLDDTPVTVTIIQDLPDSPTIDEPEKASEFYCDSCDDLIFDADPCPSCQVKRVKP